MPLYLYTSNRLEILAARLADEVRAQPLPPLMPEKIVVQSRGMARWLALSLSRHLGVWANADCPFPNVFLSEIMRRVLPDEPPVADDRQTMTWRLMGLLAEIHDETGFGELAGYLAGADEQKRFLLAWQLADLFDQYLMYRPDLLKSWEDGKDGGFQAELWRRLVSMQAGPHRAALLTRCLAAFAEPDFDPKVLPARVSVFGVSALPPSHLALFHALSRHITVSFFLMNPSHCHWADIVSAKDAARLSRRTGHSAEELFLETGNSLLADLGRQGRDFFSLIYGLDCHEEELFEAPEPETLLASVQADILELNGASPVNFDPMTDDSIVIHSCHSPMREVETLKNHLLGLFDQRPDLKASDVLVMTPDIATYGPLIQAVFDAGMNDPHRIPYSIADKSRRSQLRLVDTFFSILDLAESRFEVTKVLEVLETEAVRKHFGLDTRDLVRIRKWLTAAAIRWGVDCRERQRLGLPDFSDFSWEAGLDRLLLGWAMTNENNELAFRGIMPCDLVSGTSSQAFGRFLEYFDTLVEQTATLNRSRSLAGWADQLNSLLDALFQEDDDSTAELLVLRQQLHALRDQQDLAVFTQEVGLAPVRLHLAKTLEIERSKEGFLSGGVTFCAMLPMRAVPFKIICLLGMNDGDFPRKSKRLNFDLMAREPRPGDRSIRNDDRYLFLETLLSTRSQLYISFVGQSARDNTRIPPSVLVSGLLDYLAEKTGTRRQGALNHGLVRETRLQPFDPDHFRQNNQLTSYDRENLLAAQALLGPRCSPRPFVTVPLPEPDATAKHLTLDDLCSFFCHPVKYFCRNRLDIILPEQMEMLDDHEPFDLDTLSRYQLSSAMTDWLLNGHELKDYLAIARAAGHLPPAALGEAVYREMYGPVAAFAERIKSISGEPLPDLAVDITRGTFRITGRLNRIGKQAMLAFRPAKLKAKDLIRAWIRHLCLNCMADNDNPGQTLLVATDRKIGLQPVQASASILDSLLELYWLGMAAPLAFFPQSSLKLAEEVYIKKEPLDAGLRKAQKTWEGSGTMAGEAADPYYELCFADIDCLDNAFVDQAIKIFMPLFEHMTD